MWQPTLCIGFGYKRNQRGKQTGLQVGNFGNIQTYLEIAAKEIKRPELAVAPLVGWVGQNGPPIVKDRVSRPTRARGGMW